MQVSMHAFGLGEEDSVGCLVNLFQSVKNLF